MADALGIASLTWTFVKDAIGIVARGIEYKSTRKNLEAAVEYLSPMVEEIEHSMTRMGLPNQHVRKLKDVLAKNREDLEKHKIHVWNSVRSSWSQFKNSKDHASLERIVSVETQIQMLQLLTEILGMLNSHCQNSSAPETHHDRTLILPPRFTVGLDGSYMEEIKAKLLDAHEQVFNLYGLPGSGKTTMAKKLCKDLEDQGKFIEKNIFFEPLGSQIQEDKEIINKLLKKMSACGENPVLLVLDDVWPHSENIIEQISLRSSESRILVTSRAQMTTVTSRCQMKLLCEKDAVKLLCHWIQPCAIDFGEPKRRKILDQIVEGCKGLPLILKFIGRRIAEKNGTIAAFQEVQLEWAQGRSILDYEDLLARLQKSVDESIKKYFMDLGLFPEDQKIPVTSLIDMWAELYNLNEAKSFYAFLYIQKLIAMGLADHVIVRRTIGWDNLDNYYNNYDLVLHDLFRELAIQMSKQEPLEKRDRLIIDLYGNQNHPPKWWPSQKPTVFGKKKK